MKIIYDAKEMQTMMLAEKRAGKVIGFVPTMGALHAGHLSLMTLSRGRADVSVASIFLNPTQFGPNEDLEAYPRNFERDEKLCKSVGVDVLFYPSAEMMYAPNASTWVDEDRLSLGLCGGQRVGHFRGVCTVVAKLFNLVQPDFAVLGRKDAQQLRVVERMVRDLNFPVEIVRGDIVREPDGLAMSSRNANLSVEERAQALCLRKSLDAAQALIEQGERSVERVKAAMISVIAEASLAELDYIEILEDETLSPLKNIGKNVIILLAVVFLSARLIDNQEITL